MHMCRHTHECMYGILQVFLLCLTAKRDRLTALQAESLSELGRRVGKKKLKGANTVERKGELLRLAEVLRKVC